MRLLFVVPRYGPDIVGGAETLTRTFAERLTARGHQVTVFTTCGVDPTSLQDTLTPGECMLNGVKIKRFRVHQFSAKQLPGVTLPPDAMHYGIVAFDPHPVELYRELATRLTEFDLVIPIPYPFSMSMCVAEIAGARAAHWPCLHDEERAYVLPVLMSLRSGSGFFLNSEPEGWLLRDRLGIRRPEARVIGVGVEAPASDGERFRQALGIHEPFLLYAGRLVTQKNIPELVTYFVNYKSTHPGPLKLVLMGVGPDTGTPHPDVRLIGFQPEQLKHDAYAAALALCQPSLNESFSIVLMESWLAGTPVLVQRLCSVTHDFVTRSDGGWSYATEAQFAHCVNTLLTAPETAKAKAASGRRFVEEHMNWSAVIERFEDAALAFIEQAAATQRLTA
jgi:glycosyltransferase involved in cell wall biosynthesis